MENMRLPESYLIDALPDNPESVLDVWAGHSEIFNLEIIGHCKLDPMMALIIGNRWLAIDNRVLEV